MWGSSNFTLPRISCYADALNFWENVLPWRGEKGEYDGRPLSDRRKKHCTVRKEYDGSIVFRFYRTDCVTYYSDGRLRIKGYPSQSTNYFVGMLTPNGVSCDFTSGIGELLTVPVRVGWQTETRSYHLGTIMLKPSDLHGAWLVDDESDLNKISIYSVDRKKARAALKETNYGEFRDWIAAYKAISGKQGEKLAPFQSSGKYSKLNDRERIALLADRTKWPELLDKSGADPVTEVRMALYKQAKCGLKEERDYLSGDDDKWSIHRINNAWSHLNYGW